MEKSKLDQVLEAPVALWQMASPWGRWPLLFMLVTCLPIQYFELTLGGFSTRQLVGFCFFVGIIPPTLYVLYIFISAWLLRKRKGGGAK